MALSFRLVSLLADDLYMISKDGVMYVANSELADAQKLKVTGAETPDEESGEIEYAKVGNDVIKPVYKITDRLGKKVLVLKNEKFVLVDKDSEDAENPLAVSSCLWARIINIRLFIVPTTRITLSRQTPLPVS